MFRFRVKSSSDSDLYDTKLQGSGEHKKSVAPADPTTPLAQHLEL